MEDIVNVPLRVGACLSVAVACALLASGEAGAGPEKKILGVEKKLYSQKNEEVVIRQFFQDREGGFFLDVGSAWPIRNSNTYYLEKHLDWSGIGIDAVAKYAEAYEAKRPKTKFFNYVVTDTAGTKEKFYISQSLQGRSSTEEGRLPEAGGVVQVEVPTITLDDLLEQNGVEKVDFLSMDIEGGAPKALAGFDIAKYRPELVCIEHDASVAPERSEFLLQWFDAHGYRRIKRFDRFDKVNWYFTPES